MPGSSGPAGDDSNGTPDDKPDFEDLSRKKKEICSIVQESDEELTTTEVHNEFGTDRLGWRAVFNHLDDLAEWGFIPTKKVGGNRYWGGDATNTSEEESGDQAGAENRLIGDTDWGWVGSGLTTAGALMMVSSIAIVVFNLGFIPVESTAVFLAGFFVAIVGLLIQGILITERIKDIVT